MSTEPLYTINPRTNINDDGEETTTQAYEYFCTLLGVLYSTCLLTYVA